MLVVIGGNHASGEKKKKVLLPKTILLMKVSRKFPEPKMINYRYIKSTGYTVQGGFDSHALPPHSTRVFSMLYFAESPFLFPESFQDPG
jgi:hypothetical protein